MKKYLILSSLFVSCVSQQPRTNTYRYITVKKCPIGTVLYSDDVCRPTQESQPAKVDHYMDFTEIDKEIYRDMRKKLIVKIDCKKVLKEINQCSRGN